MQEKLVRLSSRLHRVGRGVGVGPGVAGRLQGALGGEEEAEEARGEDGAGTVLVAIMVQSNPTKWKW